MNKQIIVTLLLAVAVFGTAVPHTEPRAEPGVASTKFSPKRLWNDLFEDWQPPHFHNPFRDYESVSVPSFFRDLSRMISTKTRSSPKEETPPQRYSYSSSSFTSYSPETGPIGRTTRYYGDNRGISKKVIERRLGDKIVTETWRTDKDGKEESTSSISLSHMKRDQIADFEAEWKSKANEMHPALPSLLEQQPDAERAGLPAASKEAEQKSPPGVSKERRMSEEPDSGL